MMKNNEKKLGLYVHIPFCIRKCNYCDFLSFPGSEEVQSQYVQTLVQEMEGWREKVRSYNVDTVFIGGGTPSVLSVSDMDKVFQGIADCFSMPDLSEFTIECNPGTVTREKLELYHKAGVNRISIGMQSAADGELKKLGRIHTYDEFTRCYELVRKAGFENVNIDVMSAIPGQTIQSYEGTLQCVLKSGPEHISSYSLIIEEGTPFYGQYADEPPVDEETDRQMYELTGEVLEEAGYRRYEISNYAKPGKECRHNLKYWQRKQYLGLGLGASSFMEHDRFVNTSDPAEYQDRIRRGGHAVYETDHLSETDEKAEFMYLGLRCMQGISAREFYKCFGEELDGCFGEEIRQCVEQGLLIYENDRIYLTKRGIDVSNRVFGLFI